MKGKRIILAVSNDLVTDQRVHRCAGTLSRNGAVVRVVGRKLPGSGPVARAGGYGCKWGNHTCSGKGIPVLVSSVG